MSVYRRWAGKKDEELLTDEFEGSINDLIATFADGDLPAKCRALAASVSGLADEWELYQSYVTQSEPMPRDSFWNAVRDVEKELAGRVAPPRRMLEPVSLLIQQNVSPNQIALYMYGYQPEGSSTRIGPFLENGVPRHDLVYQEAKVPGSVLGADWVHPEEQSRLAAEAALQQRRLDGLAQRSKIGKPAPETTEQLLRQGVFPNQIARMKCITVEEVYAEAQRLGIEPTEKPDLMTMRAPQEPPINPHLAKQLDAGVQQRAESAEDLDDDSDAGDDGEGFDPDSNTDVTDAEIRQHAQNGAGVRDIAQALGVDPGRVQAVLGT